MFAELVVTLIKGHLIWEPGYIISCAGNLVEEKSCVFNKIRCMLDSEITVDCTI
jgi:hypothetical protein